MQQAEREGRADPMLALETADSLAEAVKQNRTALVALTAMKTYDNYTFTHMVNVSILTMSQARALGIEGRLLREFGLSALMHDIGKTRTPKDILNKPDKLTPAEYEIMKRHTVDGAEILRRTPEMPILAPVVAFEHHLRLDGTGYPAGAKRSSLNLGTQLCSIADVYDAMRSQRSYQRRASDRSHTRGAQGERQRALRFTPGATLLAAPGHLPAGQSRAAQLGRDRRGRSRARAGPVPAARPRRSSTSTAPARARPGIETCGRRSTRTASRLRSSSLSIPTRTGSTR